MPVVEDKPPCNLNPPVYEAGRKMAGAVPNTRELVLRLRRELNLYTDANLQQTNEVRVDSQINDACVLYLTTLDEHDHIVEVLHDCLKRLDEHSNGRARNKLQQHIFDIIQERNTINDKTTKFIFLNMLILDCKISAVDGQLLHATGDGFFSWPVFLFDEQLCLACLSFLANYAAAQQNFLLFGLVESGAAKTHATQNKNVLLLPYYTQLVLSDNKLTPMRAFLNSVQSFLAIYPVEVTIIAESDRLVQTLCDLGCQTASLDDKLTAAQCVAGLLNNTSDLQVVVSSVHTLHGVCGNDFAYMLLQCTADNNISLFNVSQNLDFCPSDEAKLTILVAKLALVSGNTSAASYLALKLCDGATRQCLVDLILRTLFSVSEYGQAKCQLCICHLFNILQGSEHSGKEIALIKKDLADGIAQKMRHGNGASSSSFLQPTLWRVAAQIFDAFASNHRNVLWHLALQNLHHGHMQTCCTEFIAKVCISDSTDDSLAVLMHLPSPSVYENVMFRILPKLYQNDSQIIFRLGQLITTFYTESRSMPLARFLPLFKFMNKISTTTSPPFYTESKLSELLLSKGIVKTLIVADDPQLTLYGSQLLFEWRRFRDPFDAFEADLFELICTNNFNRDHIRFRQPFLRHIKKFFIRLRLSSVALLKSEPNSPLLKNHEKIVRCFIDEIRMCLEPGAWHARRATVLAVLESVVGVFGADELHSQAYKSSVTCGDAHLLDNSPYNPLYFLSSDSILTLLFHALVSESNTVVQTCLVNIIVGLSISIRSDEKSTSPAALLSLNNISPIVHYFLQSYRPRDSDVAVGFTRLALSLRRPFFLYGENNMEISSRRFVVDILDKFSALAQCVLSDGLVKVLARDPLHSAIHVIRIVLVEIATMGAKQSSTKIQLFSEAECRQLTRRACDNCLLLVGSVSKIVNAQTDDSHEPLSMDFNAPTYNVSVNDDAKKPEVAAGGEPLSAQALYVCTWRIMQNISYLFGELCMHQMVQNDAELWSLVEQYFIEQLLQARHQGVFESAVDGFRQFLRSSIKFAVSSSNRKARDDNEQPTNEHETYIRTTPSRILAAMCALLSDDNDRGHYSALPILFPPKLLQQRQLIPETILPSIRVKTSNSRRSAGLPDLIMSTLKCGFERGSTLQRTCRALLDWLMSCISTRLSSKIINNIKNEDVTSSMESCVRQINVLTELLRDESLLEASAAHCGRALILAVDGLAGTNWNINCSAANLYAVLFTRFFSPRANRPISALSRHADDTSLAASDLFLRYPELFDYFYAALTHRVHDALPPPNAAQFDDVKILCVTHIISLLTTSFSDDQLGSSFLATCHDTPPPQADENCSIKPTRLTPRVLPVLTKLLYAIAVGNTNNYSRSKIAVDDVGQQQKTSSTDDAISRSARHALMATLTPYPPPPYTVAHANDDNISGDEKKASQPCCHTHNGGSRWTATVIVNDALAALFPSPIPARCNMSSASQLLLLELLRTVLVDYGLTYFPSAQRLKDIRQKVIHFLIGSFGGAKGAQQQQPQQQQYWASLREHEAALNLLHALLSKNCVEKCEPSATIKNACKIITEQLSNCILDYAINNGGGFGTIQNWLDAVFNFTFDENLSSCCECLQWVSELIVATRRPQQNCLMGAVVNRRRHANNNDVLGLALNFLTKRLNCNSDVELLSTTLGRYNLFMQFTCQLIVLFEEETTFDDDDDDSDEADAVGGKQEYYIEALLGALGSCLTILISLQEENAAEEIDDLHADDFCDAERDDTTSQNLALMFFSSSNISRVACNSSAESAGRKTVSIDLITKRLASLLLRLINPRQYYYSTDGLLLFSPEHVGDQNNSSSSNKKSQLFEEEKKEEGVPCVLFNRRSMRSVGVARQLTSLIALIYSRDPTRWTSCRPDDPVKNNKIERASSFGAEIDGLPCGNLLQKLFGRNSHLGTDFGGIDQSDQNVRNNISNVPDGSDFIIEGDFQCKACTLAGDCVKRLSRNTSPAKKVETQNFSPEITASSSRRCCCSNCAMRTIIIHFAYHENVQVRCAVAQLFVPIFLSRCCIASPQKQQQIYLQFSKSDCAVRKPIDDDDDDDDDDKQQQRLLFCGWFLAFDLLRDNSDAVRNTMCETVDNLVYGNNGTLNCDVIAQEKQTVIVESGRGGQQHERPCQSVLMRDLTTYYIRVGVATNRLAQYALASALYLAVHERQHAVTSSFSANVLCKQQKATSDVDLEQKNVCNQSLQSTIVSVFDASEAANYYSDDCAFAVLLVKSIRCAARQLKQQHCNDDDDEMGMHAAVNNVHTGALCESFAEWLIAQLKHYLLANNNLSTHATITARISDPEGVEEGESQQQPALFGNVFTRARQFAPLSVCTLRMADALRLLFIALDVIISNSRRMEVDCKVQAPLRARVQGVTEQMSLLLQDNNNTASSFLPVQLQVMMKLQEVLI